MKHFLFLIITALCNFSILAQEQVQGDFSDSCFSYEIINDTSVNLANCHDKHHDVLVIPSHVTHNGKSYTVVGTRNWAFYKNNVLKKIIFSNTITNMEGPIFYCCDSLQSIKFPALVTHIPTAAFFSINDCSLQSVDFPANLQSIGNNAFLAAKISNIRFPVSVTNIGTNAFSNTLQLELPPFLFTGGDYSIINFRIKDTASVSSISSVIPPDDIRYGDYPIGTTIETKDYTLELIHLTKDHSYVIARGKPSRLMPQDYLFVYKLGFLSIYNPNKNRFWASMLNNHDNDVTIIDYIVLKNKIVLIFSTKMNQIFIAGSYYFDGPSELQLQMDNESNPKNKLLCKYLPAKVVFVNNKSTAHLIENGKVIEELNINDFIDKYTY